MKKVTPYVNLLILTSFFNSVNAADILVESFETDGQSTRYATTTEFHDTANDHWGRTDGNNISNISGGYSAYVGSFFWAAEDVDDPQGNLQDVQTILIEDIDISAYVNLQFSGLFAAGNEGELGDSNYDAADFISIQYSIDGGSYIDGMCFNYEGGSTDSNPLSNEPFGLDADCNGQSDGAAFRLGTAMQEFSFDIPETGLLMDVLVSVVVDSGSEEVAFDQLKLSGDVNGVDTPPRVLTTVPANGAIDVSIDSHLVVSFDEPVSIELNAVTVNCSVSGVQVFPAGAVSGVTEIDMLPAAFTPFETCTVTVAANLITDLDGGSDQLDGNNDGTGGDDYVFGFTVEPDVPPVVTAIDPIDGSVGFDEAANITISFSESIDATINAVLLMCSQSGNVAFSGLPVSDSESIVINPNVNLQDTETCDLTVVATEITDNDLAADAMVENFDSSFTVGYPVLEIFDIQGTGLISSYEGIRVTTLDNIVTVVGPAGFFMQTPDARDDLNPVTSNGIYVYTGGAPSVSVGDQIDLTGDVVEYFNFTEFSNPGSYVLNVDSSNNPLPTAVLLNDTFPPTDPNVLPCQNESLEYECLEGMHFTMPQGYISVAYASFFGANRDDVLVKAGSARAFREPGIDSPGLPGLPVYDGNPELLEMDIDGLGLDFATNNYAAGSEVSITGVFGYDFGEYEIWPSSITALNENILPGEVRDALPDEVTIGSANLYRLFDDIDDPGTEDDDQIEDSMVYANRLLKLAKYFVNDLKSPTIIGLQEIENLNVLNDLVLAISNAGGPSYTAELIEGNDKGGIDVAVMYQSALFNQVAVTQLGASELNDFDGSLLHDRPPLLFEGEVVLNQGTLPVKVLVVHMRSRGSIDSVSDGDRVRSKRLQQANSVAAMIDTIITAEPETGLYVIGDWNAFQFTDGYVDVIGQVTGEALQADNLLWSEPLFVNNPLTQAVQTLPEEEQYSYIYQGTAQVLDNAIMNDVGLMNLVEIQFVRGQADAALSYEDDNSTSVRSSDHDAFVLYIYEDNDLIFKNSFE